jgi:Nif-specific regulatory protein
MSARQFSFLYLFFTPHTRANALATTNEIARKFGDCRVAAHELPVSDPKDYSSLMGSLCQHLRDLAIKKDFRDDKAFPNPEKQKKMADIYEMRKTQRLASQSNYVCVSSGTAEMRAAWFLVTALGILPAKLLQVGTPAYPLFGEVNVKEVHIETTDWETVRNLVMPAAYFGTDFEQYLLPSSSSRPVSRGVFSTKGKRNTPRDWGTKFHRIELGAYETKKTLSSRPERVVLPSVPGLDNALQELGIYVGSAVLRHAAERAGIAAASHLPVLLLGETGTGKERFAHLIHRLSPRFHKDLVAINCAAIPQELAESHLFGHMKGAFTDASSDRKGMFEYADQSTLFLDEIGDLTMPVQAKLLRVIQDGAVLRVGSMTPRQVNVRIIAATNRDLKSDVAAGRFREDLYFRLEVVQIKLPALRERRNEIPELALALLRQINQRRQKPHQLSKLAIQRLENYCWPGNVRQLSNVLERSVLYAQADVVDADDLLIADDVSVQDPLAMLPEPSQGFSIEDYMIQVRKQLFRRALAKCNGNRTEAAALLGVTRQAVSKFLSGESDNPS